MVMRNDNVSCAVLIGGGGGLFWKMLVPFSFAASFYLTFYNFIYRNTTVYHITVSYSIVQIKLKWCFYNNAKVSVCVLSKQKP